MNEIFLLATRTALRFDIRGNISTEQLWSIPKDELIPYEESLQTSLEKFGKSTRRTAGRKTKAQETLELQLAVVSAVLDIKIAEETESKEAAKNKAHNESIMALIADKQQDELKGKSVEELKAMLK
jgi:hypothetical protein